MSDLVDKHAPATHVLLPIIYLPFHYPAGLGTTHMLLPHTVIAPANYMVRLKPARSTGLWDYFGQKKIN